MLIYEQEYLKMLETAFNFLFRKGKPVNGSPLNQAKHEFIVTNGGCCLHCGIRLTPKNSNTEHIHDRALGGINESSNKIIMCTSCNLARNKTMQIYLGPPSYWQGFPGNWDRVKKYLLWNAVTVDKGHHAGESYPEVHHIFESILQSNGKPIKPPNNWFGRGNYCDMIVTEPTRRGFWIRVFDRIFGYESSQNTPVIAANRTNHAENAEKIVKPEREILNIDESFRHHILTALSSIQGEVDLATFSSYFQLYLVSKDMRKQSLKQFAHSFGIPKRRSFIEIIEDYFPNEIDYRRVGQTVVYITMKNREVFEYLANEDE